MQALARHLPEEQIGGTEESRHEAGGRVTVETLRAADFQQAAHLHDANPVRERKRFLLIVGDQDGAHADTALHRAHGLAQLDADLGVERAERFVQQQNGGLVRQRTRDGHALLLTARELARVALVVALEGDQLQELRRRRRRSAARMLRTRSANSMLSATVMWRNSA